MIWDLVIGKRQSLLQVLLKFCQQQGSLLYWGYLISNTIIICQAVREINMKLVSMKSYVILY